MKGFGNEYENKKQNSTTKIYKNNIQSDDLINQNNVIKQNSYISIKGSFKGKGSDDALK